MVQIMGKPVLGWVIDNLRKYGINNNLVSIYYLAEKIIPYLEEKGVGIHLRNRELNTAAALKEVESYSSDPFIVANGDTITNVNISEMIKHHKASDSIATVFTHDTLTHCGGTYIFNKEVLKYIPDKDNYSIDKNLIPDLLKNKLKLSKFTKDYFYYDIGDRAKLAKARESLSINVL